MTTITRPEAAAARETEAKVATRRGAHGEAARDWTLAAEQYSAIMWETANTDPLRCAIAGEQYHAARCRASDAGKRARG